MGLGYRMYREVLEQMFGHEALHLSHGFKSAFQSLGLYHNKFNGTIRFVGYALAILLALGFAGIPVALLMGAGGPL